MSEFEGYIKISESSNNWILDRSDIAAFKRTAWCVTEKIHGANFCFLCNENGQRVRCGKRTDLLSDSDHFFGYKRRVSFETMPKIQQLYQFFASTLPGLEKLYVFGELFGGHYPHPDVPNLPNVNAVQTGIWYCPDIEFCAFDSAAVVNGKQSYLDYELSLAGFQHANLFHAEPLFIGKYEEAMDFQLGFNSSIPSKFGLPTLVEGNKAEGIVIKPMHEIQVRTTKGSLVRAILKNKIREFSEEKFSQAQKQEVTNNGELSNVDLLRFEIDALLTENRLNNAISKVGSVAADQKDKLRELLNLYVDDVINQLCENGNEQMWKDLPENDRRLLTEEITLAAKKFIIKYLKKNKRDTSEQ
jgi:Rnl2 family RNA ligase